MIIGKYLKTRPFQFNLHYRYHNFYDVLQVEHGASQQQIKHKYFQLAKKYHPDRHNIQDPSKFIKINEAYQTLGDQHKRRHYDNSFYSKNNKHQSYNSNYHQNYDHSRTYQSNYYRPHPESNYKEPFIDIVKRSYFSIIVWMILTYMAIQIFRFGMERLDKHDKQERQKLIDNTPGVMARRKKFYQKQIKERNIYSQLIDLKVTNLTKESTKTKQKRKEGLISIEGIKKYPIEQKCSNGVPQTEYM